MVGYTKHGNVAQKRSQSLLEAFPVLSGQIRHSVCLTSAKIPMPLLLIVITTNRNDLTGKAKVLICTGLVGELCMLPDIYDLIFIGVMLSIFAIWFSDNDWRE
jgi:hypothetical protein